MAKASQTRRNIGWFAMMHVRGHGANDKVAHYQVTTKVGFTVDDERGPVGFLVHPHLALLLRWAGTGCDGCDCS
jgi:hypothetical protein